MLTAYTAGPGKSQYEIDLMIAENGPGKMLARYPAVRDFLVTEIRKVLAPPEVGAEPAKKLSAFDRLATAAALVETTVRGSGFRGSRSTELKRMEFLHGIVKDMLKCGPAFYGDESGGYELVQSIEGLIDGMALKLRSTTPAVPTPGRRVDGYTQLFFEITVEFSEIIRRRSESYHDITTQQSNLHDVTEAVREDLEILAEWKAKILKHPPANSPSAVLDVSHQYAKNGGGVLSAFFDLLAKLDRHNGAHEEIAPIADTRVEILNMMRKFMGWVAPEQDSAATIVVDSGTRGNQMGIQYLVQTARMAEAFFQVVTSGVCTFIPDVPLPPQLLAYIEKNTKPNGKHAIPKRLQDLKPKHFLGCPLAVLAATSQAVHEAIRGEYLDDAASAEWAMSQFLKEVGNRTKSNIDSKGSNTTIFSSKHLHYTLTKALYDNAREEKRVEMNFSDLSSETGRSNYDAVFTALRNEVAKGRHVILCTVMGSTSFGSIDDYPALLKMKKSLEAEFGRSFTVHVDGAWGGRFRSMVVDPKDGSVVPYKDLEHHKYFAGKRGRSRYDRLVAASEIADSFILDAHKDITPYSSAVIVLRHGKILAPPVFRVEAPYLDFGIGTLWREDESRPGVCSHSWAATTFLWFLLKRHFLTGEMGQRHINVANHVDEIADNLTKERFRLRDGTPARLVLAHDPTTAILNFVVTPEVGSHTADARNMNHLTGLLTDSFSGAPDGDPEASGIRVSSTIASARAFSRANVVAGDELKTLRLVVQGDDQLSTKKRIKIPGTKPVTPYDFTVKHFSRVLGKAALQPFVSLSTDVSNPRLEFMSDTMYRSPRLRTSVYGRSNVPEHLFFMDVHYILATLERVIPIETIEYGANNQSWAEGWKRFWVTELGSYAKGRLNELLKKDARGHPPTLIEILLITHDVLKELRLDTIRTATMASRESLESQLAIVQTLAEPEFVAGLTRPHKHNSEAEKRFSAANRTVVQTISELRKQINTIGDYE